MTLTTRRRNQKSPSFPKLGERQQLLCWDNICTVRAGHLADLPSFSQLQRRQQGLVFCSPSHLPQCHCRYSQCSHISVIRRAEFFLSHRQCWRLFLSLYDCCCFLFSWTPLLCPSSPISAVSLCLLWSCFLLPH